MTFLIVLVLTKYARASGDEFQISAEVDVVFNKVITFLSSITFLNLLFFLLPVYAVVAILWGIIRCIKLKEDQLILKELKTVKIHY